MHIDQFYYADRSATSIWAQSTLLLWSVVWEWEHPTILLLVSISTRAPEIESFMLLAMELSILFYFSPFLHILRLDVGDGREINLDKCSRSNLQNQCIKYLGPVWAFKNFFRTKEFKLLSVHVSEIYSVFVFVYCRQMQNEREAYQVIVRDGKLIYKKDEVPVCTIEGSKWIFVLSTSRELYVGQVHVWFIRPFVCVENTELLLVFKSARPLEDSDCLISWYDLLWAEKEGQIPAL